MTAPHIIYRVVGESQHGHHPGGNRITWTVCWRATEYEALDVARHYHALALGFEVRRAEWYRDHPEPPWSLKRVQNQDERLWVAEHDRLLDTLREMIDPTMPMISSGMVGSVKYAVEAIADSPEANAR